MTTFTKLFRAPYAVPNGLQWTEEGLWIVDQITDRVALIENNQPGDYGVTKLIQDIPSESSNTSGLSHSGNTLWLAANGGAQLWRPPRHHDAQPHQGEILQVDQSSGKTLSRHPLPGGGGTHGVEYDPFEQDVIWLTTLKSQTLSKVQISSWSVLNTIALPYERAHGVVRVPDGLWVAHTGDRVIVKLDLNDGHEIERIIVPSDLPEPHGLSILGDPVNNPYAHRRYLYCDATTGWVVEVSADVTTQVGQ